MLKLLTYLLVFLVLCFVLRLLIGVFSANLSATGLTQTDNAQPILLGCDDLSNCISSTASNKKNRVEPVEYSSDKFSSNDALFETLENLINAEAGATVLTRTANYLHATFKTRLLGYTDDFELLLDEDGTLHVRSASRIGKSDLGANRKRIEALREKLKGKI